MKKEISIQYYVTNIRLFQEVFYNWQEFYQNLSKGLDNMQEYLYNLWNKSKEELLKRDFTITDLDKVVKKEDFDITINFTEKNTTIFFFTFPDHPFKDASSKYVAIALCKNMPRYFTMEYAASTILNQGADEFVIGEFVPRENGQNKHINYGFFDNSRLTFFAGYIMGMLNEYEKQEIN